MAKHSSHIMEMARKGAEHRFHELRAELASLVKSFPHLASLERAVRRGRPVGSKNLLKVAKRVRRKMSKAARAAISAAQKARWAKQKAGKK